MMETLPDSLVQSLQVLQFDASLIIGAFVIMILGAIAWKLVQKFVIGSVEGITSFWGHNLDEDDIVWIYNGTRKARVARTGWLQTVFYMYDNNTKLVVSNIRLASLGIEKKLSTNGGGKEAH